MTISTFMTFSFVTVVLQAEKYGEDGGQIDGDREAVRSPASAVEKSDLELDFFAYRRQCCNYG